MSCDLFVSYSRRDKDRVNQLVELIKADFAALFPRSLEVFIDPEIRPMDDWHVGF